MLDERPGRLVITDEFQGTMPAYNSTESKDGAQLTPERGRQTGPEDACPGCGLLEVSRQRVAEAKIRHGQGDDEHGLQRLRAGQQTVCGGRGAQETVRGGGPDTRRQGRAVRGSCTAAGCGPPSPCRNEAIQMAWEGDFAHIYEPTGKRGV